MSETATKNDLLTVAAIAVIAGCMVTFDHEALGHGGVCLTLGGKITLLSSSLFRCDARSAFIDPAGPLSNLTIGALALILSRFVKPPALRLFLILVTAFSWFWEGGYVVQAMLLQKGDLYETGRNFIGRPDMPWRIGGAILGIGLYIATLRMTGGALLRLWPLDEARRTARISWLAATAATALAAFAYRGGIGQDLHDAVMEIGIASLPLLLIPLRAGTATTVSTPVITRSFPIIIAALIVFIAFTLTLGHGFGQA